MSEPLGTGGLRTAQVVPVEVSASGLVALASGSNHLPTARQPFLCRQLIANNSSSWLAARGEPGPGTAVPAAAGTAAAAAAISAPHANTRLNARMGRLQAEELRATGVRIGISSASSRQPA